MANRLPLPLLREQAIALRRAGKSRREIQQILQIRSNGTLNEVLRGEPPQPWTRRPNAKDDVRAKARELRQQGLAYKQIAAQLGVSMSTVSLWVRDMARPERLSYEECAKRRDAAVAAYWERERPRRANARQSAVAGARSSICGLTDREIIIAGAIAYWCEGSKNKAYRRTDRISFINSDPALIRFFLRFLEMAGVTQNQLAFRLSIHESADVASAQEFWLRLTQAAPDQFRRPSLKRHNPSTVRLNTGPGYHGCLRVDVLRGGTLYTQIEGWCDAIMAGAETAAGASSQWLFEPDARYRERAQSD